MQVNTLLTGSFPPQEDVSPDDFPDASIRNAVQQQISAGVNVLVDGQVRSDIVGIFARRLGLEEKEGAYRARSRLGVLQESVTLPDLETAAAEAEGRPLMAHITGPTVIAESVVEDEATPEFYRGNTGFRQLTLDLAAALATEARFIANRAGDLNIQYLQIDEPSLVYGADMALAREAVGVVARAWREAGGGPVLLHICGDIGSILKDLVLMPVDILNVVNVHLREAAEDSLNALRESNKKLALGVIPVNTDKLPTPQRVAQELLYASDRYGPERVWGATPNCGLRRSTPELASRRITCLVEAAGILRDQPGRSA